MDLWNSIGYSPENGDLQVIENELEVDQVDHFTPVRMQTFPLEKFGGVSIKQFPLDSDQGAIVEFLCNNGLAEADKEKVTFKPNGVVIINCLDTDAIKKLIETIHGKIWFGKKLYCNGLVPLTPEKLEDTSGIQSDIKENTSSAQLVSLVEPSISQPVGIVSDNDGVSDLVRRHSLSLHNRTPEKGSLAEDLLNAPRFDLEKTNLMINELKEQLSDFASCIESSQASSDDSNDERGDKNDGFKTLNEKKRIKKSKRKHKMSPDKEIFLKKPNLTKS